MFNMIYQVLGVPLGWVMWLCYQVIHNYGLSLLVFTILMRLILFPISLKQQKSTIKMTLIQPKMQELQKKYANNKEKLNEEMMKLYQQEGYNPMSGCLPLLIQMPILFGLIDVIYRPLKHILRLPADVITHAEEIALSNGLIDQITNNLSSNQIRVINGVHQNPGMFDALGAETLTKIQSLDLNFIGINLGDTPGLYMFKEIFTQFNFDLLLLVPILSGISALVVSLFSMRNASPATEAAGAGASMKGMMLMMPVFSFIIAFNVPAGVGIYWFYSNLCALVQTMILNKFYNPKEMAAKAKQEYEEKQEQLRQERIEAKKKAKEGALEDQEKALSQKEINRRKLAEARKRNAEKYGEDYVDVTDDDLK